MAGTVKDTNTAAKRLREPQQPIAGKVTRRQQRTGHYKKLWKWKRDLAQRRAQKKEAKGIPYRKARPPLRVRSADVIRALEFWRDSTGDPRFTDALDAIAEYGLGRQPQLAAQHARERIFGHPLDAALGQVRFLVERGEPSLVKGRRRRFSIQEACENIAAHLAIPAATFEAAVQALRDHYRENG